MVVHSREAVQDLTRIEAAHGRDELLTLFAWCQELDEPSVRAEAERLGDEDEIYRLRVGDYNVTYTLEDSGEAVQILRIRRRR